VDGEEVIVEEDEALDHRVVASRKDDVVGMARVS